MVLTGGKAQGVVTGSVDNKELNLAATFVVAVPDGADLDAVPQNVKRGHARIGVQHEPQGGGFN
jgi:hypothetical protein